MTIKRSTEYFENTCEYINLIHQLFNFLWKNHKFPMPRKSSDVSILSIFSLQRKGKKNECTLIDTFILTKIRGEQASGSIPPPEVRSTPLWRVTWRRWNFWEAMSFARSWSGTMDSSTCRLHPLAPFVPETMDTLDGWKKTLPTLPLLFFFVYPDSRENPRDRIA